MLAFQEETANITHHKETETVRVSFQAERAAERPQVSSATQVTGQLLHLGQQPALQAPLPQALIHWHMRDRHTPSVPSLCLGTQSSKTQFLPPGNSV